MLVQAVLVQTLAVASFPCFVHKGCQECAADSACGWCARNATTSPGACLPAGENGLQLQPRSGGRTCPIQQWRHKQCEGGGDDVCGGYDSCTACAKNLRCGWCAGGGLQLPHCALGNPLGPERGQCSYWQQGFCTGAGLVVAHGPDTPPPRALSQLTSQLDHVSRLPSV